MNTTFVRIQALGHAGFALVMALVLTPATECLHGQDLVSQQLASTSQTLDSSNTIVNGFDQEITKALADWQVPGLAVAVVKDDKVLLSKGYGVRRTGSTDKVDADTLFAIASNSKAFTAAALAILVDEGKLKWDDRVTDHLPWFRLKDPMATADIRVRDLLCHRSGLGTFSGDLLCGEHRILPRNLAKGGASGTRWSLSCRLWLFELDVPGSWRSNRSC